MPTSPYCWPNCWPYGWTYVWSDCGPYPIVGANWLSVGESLWQLLPELCSNGRSDEWPNCCAYCWPDRQAYVGPYFRSYMGSNTGPYIGSYFRSYFGSYIRPYFEADDGTDG